jgi:hypothetical protein
MCFVMHSYAIGTQLSAASDIELLALNKGVT